MRHLISGRFISRRILVVLCALAFACIGAPTALAQRGGAHVSGPHMAPPPRPAPAVRPPVVRPMPSTPPAGFGTPAFRVRRPFPIRPGPPFRPVIVSPIFVSPIFVAPFFPGFGFGWGFGFNSFWPSYCGPALFWNFGCGVGPSFGYGLGYSVPYTGPSYPYQPAPYAGPAYPAPLYLYGSGGRDLVQLFMKDGTVYSVLDYWVVDNELHFTTSDGGETPTEHVVSLDDLDMQKTVDVNTQRGFNFMLRNEPIEQYLEDHPDASPQDQPAAPQDQSAPGNELQGQPAPDQPPSP